MIAGFLAYVAIYSILGIVFAFGWALFVSPVFGMPVLEPLEIVGVVLFLMSFSFYFALTLRSAKP